MKNVNVNLPGYRITNQLYTGSRTLVYRGIRETDQYPVVLKLLREEYPSFAELVRFRNQYVIAQNLALPSVVKPLALERYRQGYALVMEDVGGISLANYLKQTTANSDHHFTPLSIADFFQIGLQLAETLWEVHRCRVIHKDIKPANILIQAETLQVKLIDFSISSLLPKETPEIENPNVLEGTLAYLSPEQTGRMNRGIDYRCDFYSLGVTFYELLTGQLPFQADDPIELVHCHIAKSPLPVAQIHPHVPQMISEIVSKLMAKNAEDRYQSGLGLKHDLERCFEEWKQRGEITLFPLGKRDVSDRFLIPEKLYGRELEVQTLLAAFDRVSEGKTELMLIAGFSGIGKTAVVNEVHKPIVRQRGYFIKGKYDQFNRNIPLSAFVQAFRELMGQLLSESDSQLQGWKTKILAALGENAQVMIDVIPELEEILGQQPPVPELSGSAAQNRFNLLFQKFIEVFTTPEHPLVIFLDDLQWADSASLNLMQVLMSQNEIGYLLMIGAYRDNEVSPAHPLILTLEKIQKSQALVKKITLDPLQESSVNQLIADTLNCSPRLALPLTELVISKTKGNPFFTTQFLKALYEDGLITFNFEESHWECDIAQIQQLALTDDVVEFMAIQLQKLPQTTQDILKLAACIGNSFDLATLAIVSEKSEIETATVLWIALQESLVIPQTQVYKFYLQQTPEEEATPIVSYKFLHDRVQQAAYSLIPDEQKQITHYHIGQLLLEQISTEARIERIFELVNQLNYGTSLITQQTEKDELAQLNLIACRQARSSTAYQAAREYAKIGLSILGENRWQRQYEMSLEFHNLSAELASLCGDFEAMEQFVETVIVEAKSLLEQVNVYRIIIFANVAQNKLTEAITIAQNLLKQLGVDLPETPTPEDVQQAMAEIPTLIGEGKIEDLIHLPIMTDEEKIAIVQIANSIIPAAYITGSALLPLVVSLSVKLSILYGNIPASAFAYACYSIIACNLVQDVYTGVKFGQLALQVSSKLDAKAAKPEAFATATLFSLHRQYPIKETLQVSQEGYTAALEVGNLDFAGRSAYTYCINAFWCGQPLTTLEQETGAYCNGLVQLKQLTTANYCRIYWQSILNLLGAVEHPNILSGEALQEAEFLPHLIKANDLFGLYFFYLYKLMLCYLFGEIEQAENHAVEVRRYFMGGIGTVGEPAFYFYDSLTALAPLSSSSGEISEETLERVKQNQTKLQQNWAHYAPMNHQHKVDLVEAEKCRVLGQKTEAIEFYDQAISGAKTNEYLQEEALANELAARFYLNWGKEKVAAGYLLEAYYGYAHWGAKAKTDELEKHDPHLLQPILNQPLLRFNPLETLATLIDFTPSVSETRSTHAPSSSSLSEALDFAAVLKAAQAINRSIQLEELICRLTQIILENSGAETCMLLLPHKNQWQIRAITRIELGCSEPVTHLQTTPLDSSTEVPVRLIQSVRRTLEPMIIDDLKINIPGVMDEYLLEYQPQSILCMPILNQATLVGVLYLEHRLTKRVFTRDRLLVLNFLCTQAAISLENARLYQQATQALTDLQAAQLQLIQSEKMSALGSLMAGIAHEINNPVGFISGNLSEAQQGIKDLIHHLHLYSSKTPETEILDHAEDIDLDYLIEDLPRMVDSMKIGCDRIKGISSSLRIFSRADQNHPVRANLHQGIDSTLLILKHRLKASEFRPAIQVITNYGNIPEIECFPGQLNQVFMNILANGIEALDESCQGINLATLKANPKQILIATELSTDEQSVEIHIADNGTGIAEEMEKKIFDHLFTTKAVGKGTGLGLAIAKSIVVEKHGGTITVKSKLKEGTEFIITLPIKARIKS